MLCVSLSNVFIYAKTFSHLLDEPSILHKSTRHVHHNHELSESELNKNVKKYHEKHLTTPYTTVIRGLLDDYCFSDSDCTQTYSICGQRERRCMCKSGTRRSDNGKSCILDNEIREYLELRNFPWIYCTFTNYPLVSEIYIIV